jgi:hypothetical protein
MEKTLIEITKAIHTFDEIKEAAKYKLEFLEKIEKSKRGIAKYEGSYCRSVFKENFIDDPVEFCYIAMNGCSAKELEESLIDLCVAGIDIEEYFICKKQKKKKAKFCGEKDYKFLCSKLNKKTHRKR